MLNLARGRFGAKILQSFCVLCHFCRFVCCGIYYSHGPWFTALLLQLQRKRVPECHELNMSNSRLWYPKEINPDIDPVAMNYRPSYTIDEDLKILRLIIDNNAYYLLKTTSWWQDLENSNKFDGRTWQSLKERFIKKIMPSVSTYDIDEVEKIKLKLAWHELERNFSQSALPEGIEVCFGDEESDAD